MSIHYVYICWCPWTLLCIILKIVTSKQTTTTLVNPWPFSVKVTTACKVNFHTVKFLKKVLKDYLSRYIVDSSRGGGLVSQLLIALISEPTLQHRALLEKDHKVIPALLCILTGIDSSKNCICQPDIGIFFKCSP